MNEFQRDNLKYIIHELNVQADEYYSTAHPIKDFEIDYENVNKPPEILIGSWKTLMGNVTKRKRILVGENFLNELIDNKMNNVSEFIKEHIKK